MASVASVQNFANCLTVGEAAKYLGVSTATLRNWDRAGKLKPRRHPHNGYRIYLHEDLQALLRSAELDRHANRYSAAERIAPSVDWTQMGDAEHFVQFYESDEFLIESVCGYVATALERGNGSVVIATAEHRIALQRKLAAAGLDVGAAIESGRYVVFDAAEALSKIMLGDAPDARQFMQMIGGAIAQVSEGGRSVSAFGEMVALLWADGNRDAAIRLEELWNELSSKYRFSLFCAYPLAEFGGEDDGIPFKEVCGCHSRVIPAENYSAIGAIDDRLRAVSLLQQRAQSLSAEIEHRKEVERMLTQRERELADFFDNASEGLHKVGPDGTILWANKAELDLLGYSSGEYIGHSITEFHVDSDIIDAILHKLRNGETLVNFPARMRCKNGQLKHVLLSSNAYFEHGRFVYTRCFTRDITQQWQAEDALRETLRRKDEFLATLSHELRNPLAPIRNALELLRLGVRDPQIVDEARSVIHRQAKQLTRLVDDLLDVSRIGRDKIELRRERVELRDVIYNALETARPLIDAAHHELTMTLPASAVWIEADPARMAQVFGNLLTNAAKYTDPGGRIEIHAEQDREHVSISVRDNGVGIPCDELAFVFDMFRQVDQSLERAQGGLGIGLTLVRQLVELHGGTVDALSEGLSHGSEFIVKLPVAPPEKPAGSEGERTERPASGKRILVVDDNQDAGYTLCLLLRLQGHEVKMALDGLQAIEMTKQFAPEVILMDVGMPKLNGYDATRRIRQLPGGNKIFIIALTGWGQASDREQSAAAGCSAHLVKPVDLPCLQQMLSKTGGSS